MISNADLLKLMLDIESDSIEKTISKTNADKIGEAICAFSNDIANTNTPSYLLIGVNDNGSIQDIGIDEQLLQTLMSFRTDGRIVPPPVMTVTKASLPHGEVAVVEVSPSFQPPVRYKGRVHIRIGARRGVANEGEERLLSEKRSTFAKTYDCLPCIGSTVEDMSIEQFKITYLPAAIDAETLAANHRDLRQQLSSLKFYDLIKDCPTNLGILVFGINPRFFLSGAYIQYVKFKGEDVASEFEYEKRFEGDLVTQFRVIRDFIKSQIVKSVQNSLGTPYIHNYPMTAIEELLYNAIIHRDYQSNAAIKFYEFSDRIEITNPGGLYGNARPENFPTTNDYRNPALAEAARTLGYVNTFNVGVQRAIDALIKNGNPTPEFLTAQPTSFGVIIYKKQL